MDSDTGKIARNEQLVQFDRTNNRFHEDDDLFNEGQWKGNKLDLWTNLIEFQGVKQFVQLSVLSSFTQLHEVLL
jgi:hypothetical protein